MEGISSGVFGLIGVIAGIVIQHAIAQRSRLGDELRIQYAAWLGSARVMVNAYVRGWSGRLSGVSHERFEQIQDQIELARGALESDAARLLLLERCPQWRRTIATLMWSLRESTWHEGLGPRPAMEGPIPLLALGEAWCEVLDQVSNDLIERHPILSVAGEIGLGE